MNRKSLLKNRIFCAGALLVSLLFTFFYGGKVPYTLFFTVLSMIALSLLYLAAARYFCDVSCTLDKRDVIKGGEIILTIEIKNDSLLFIPYVNITYRETAEFTCDVHDESLSVGARSGKRARVALTSKYRGRYDLNIVDIRLMDFLGIANVSAIYAKLPDALVYPHILELDEFTAVGKFDLDNQMNPDSISEDVTAVSDVREYMEGDGMRRIHWNLSARMMSFMSKNYENITKSRLTLLLNLSGKSGLEYEQRLGLEDKMIETAVSLVYHFLNKFWNVTLCYYENEYYMYSLSDAGMFGMAYDHLAFVGFSAAYDIAKIVENVSQETAGEFLNLCVITQDVTTELLDRVIRYAELGSRIALLYICESAVGLDMEDWVKAIYKSPVSLYIVDITGDLRAALAI